MRNLIKKSLAFCLVAALALTCFVGSVSAAETYSATISVANQTITQGTTSVDVVLDIASADAGINEALIKVSSTLGTIASEATVVESDSAAVIEYDQGTTDYGTFYLSAQNVESETGTTLGSVKSAKIKLTFTVAADVAVGDYDIVIDIPDDKVIAASANEDIINFTYTTAKVTVEAAVSEPVVDTAVGFRGDIVVSSVVGANIFISTKNMRETYGNDASYYIVVDYKKYAEGYVLVDKSVTYTTADRLEGGVSNNNKDLIAFNELALYEMTLDFKMTAYFKNGDGEVVAYKEVITNIADMALIYANTYSTNTTLLTALADMCVYGDEAQKYFASVNPGTDICDAVLPSTILGETYMANKSSSEGMPAAGEYNDDKGYEKIVSTTGFLSSNQNLVIGASNQISYLIRYDNYDWANMEIKVHYEDSINGYKEISLTEADMIPNGTTNSGMPKYTYYFKDLALYDCDKTVTMDMYYNGTKELTSVYSFGNFVNDYINDASMGAILTAMELFSNSVGIQLGLAARW